MEEIRSAEERPLRVAVLSPPWIPVPPPGYGGIEVVLDLLCRALVRRGNDVTLFAAPGSRSEATVVTPLEEPHPEEIEHSLHESDHVARAFEMVDAGQPGSRPYDVIHDNCGFTAVAMADRVETPLVHTIHRPLDEPCVRAFYEHHGHKVTAVSLTEAQAARAPDGLVVEAVIPNPIDVPAGPLVGDKEDFLLWIGRMTECKGPQRALEVARRCHSKLVLAGPVQPGEEEFFEAEVEPQLRSSRVTYVGEVGGRRKRQLFARARAVLMPIRWPEPFGMVMVEALAAGTPVIAFREGSAPEIVEDGVSGFLVDDEEEMAAATTRLASIDPRACRESVQRFDSDRVAARYEAAYRRAAHTAPVDDLTIVAAPADRRAPISAPVELNLPGALA
ncbi:MAG TPA: glycosyltransferase family 4 protein [Solirubrobacterales bacterium]|jgi:glycosyltransferase involved in cell wall biosynthesis